MQTKERPILFSTEMVQAILDGRKTQTRRMVKGNPNSIVKYKTAGDEPWTIKEGLCEEGDLKKKYVCPYGKPGDLLWVRETWAHASLGRIAVKNEWVVFKADGHDPKYYPRWKPSIHMPKAAARIWLKVKSVRVERLQDISEEDAKAEGVETENGMRYKVYGAGLNSFILTPRASFTSLWKVINGPDSWNKNPWVWVVEFEVLSTTGKEASHG